MLGLAGTALVGGGVALGILPFRTTMPAGEAHELRPDPLRAKCRSPIVAAWNHEEKGQVALWAVTKGADAYRYEVRCWEGPYCARPARWRLGASVLAVGVGAIVTGISFRPRHPG